MRKRAFKDIPFRLMRMVHYALRLEWWELNWHTHYLFWDMKQLIKGGARFS